VLDGELDHALQRGLVVTWSAKLASEGGELL
jgi:hypothetical protein